MAEVFKGLVNRSDKGAFMGVAGAGGTLTYHRMTKFTDLGGSKNPQEYSRQYVDKSTEDTDVVGYSPTLSYGFDQYIGNPVHEDIAHIHDEELLGDATIRNIAMIDFTSEGTTEGTFKARLRPFSIIPDADGDSTDAYTYSGTCHAKDASVTGTATTLDGWATCEFTEDV